MSKTSEAPGSGAGHIFQLERALYHLGRSGPNDYVAVEYADDVTVSRGGHVVLREQDKHSIRPKADILGDRSRALWRTLQIWLTPNPSIQCSGCKRFLLVTNNPAAAPIASMLKALANRAADVTPKKIVGALRAAGRPRRKSQSQVQTIIDDVLSRRDQELVELISRIEIVEAKNERGDLDDLANCLRGREPEEVGIKILERSTYEYLEPLGSDPCNELYMTSGHYHRLADEDSVWWHPDYRPRSEE